MRIQVILLVGFLSPFSAFAGMNVERLMEFTSKAVIQASLSDQMPDCAGLLSRELEECVVLQGWGDFNSEGFDPNHEYQDEQVIVYFQDKSDLKSLCFIEVVVDPSSEAILSMDQQWKCQ